MARVAGVGADVDVVLGVGHEVHPPQVGGLVGGLEGEVALLRLAGVPGRPDDQRDESIESIDQSEASIPDDQAGHVGLAPLVLTITVTHASKSN